MNDNTKKSQNLLTRKIKCLGNCVEKNDFILHPITLNLIKNKLSKTACPSELHFLDGELKYVKACTSNKNIMPNDIQKFMALPYLNLSYSEMLAIYSINTVDDLINWLENKIKEDVPFQYINRIINIWIKYNYNDLINNSNILVKIYNILNNKYWSLDLPKLDKFILNWFKNKDYEDFSFNLGNDIFIKYKKKQNKNTPN
jgi:hypothetical protein